VNCLAPRRHGGFDSHMCKTNTRDSRRAVDAVSMSFNVKAHDVPRQHLSCSRAAIMLAAARVGFGRRQGWELSDSEHEGARHPRMTTSRAMWNKQSTTVLDSARVFRMPMTGIETAPEQTLAT
jgi:hypothetical protein